MGRIVVLVLGFGLSCLLVTGLMNLTGEFEPHMPKVVYGQNKPQNAGREPSQTIQLPSPVPGTNLMAERLVCYEGPFLEDCSDVPVSDIAALLVRNMGSSIIESASVCIERAGEAYEFNVTYILPGMPVLVLEKSASGYFRDGITKISGWEKHVEDDSVLSGLRLEAVDMGSIALTNLTSETRNPIALFHKNYLPDGIFVGGITYKTVVSALTPGQTILISPEHYADGYSKIFYAE